MVRLAAWPPLQQIHDPRELAILDAQTNDRLHNFWFARDTFAVRAGRPTSLKIRGKRATNT